MSSRVLLPIGLPRQRSPLALPDSRHVTFGRPRGADATQGDLSAHRGTPEVTCGVPRGSTPEVTFGVPRGRSARMRRLRPHGEVAHGTVGDADRVAGGRLDLLLRLLRLGDPQVVDVERRLGHELGGGAGGLVGGSSYERASRTGRRAGRLCKPHRGGGWRAVALRSKRSDARHCGLSRGSLVAAAVTPCRCRLTPEGCRTAPPREVSRPQWPGSPRPARRRRP